MDYHDLHEHLSLFNDIVDNNIIYDWPGAIKDLPLLSSRIIYQGLKLKRVLISDIETVIGGLATEFESSELILALHCNVYSSPDSAYVDLQYAHACYAYISASAISGKYIERSLSFYKDRGELQLMLAKNGLFWLRAEPSLQKSQT